NAGGERNIVGESAFAPALVDAGLTRAGYCMTVGFKHAPALKVPVVLPDPPRAVVVFAVQVTRQNPQLVRVGNRGRDGRRAGGDAGGFSFRTAPERPRPGADDEGQHGD